ncbi:hypothetical protein [Streptomyces sp. NPDC087297]|uniref:hypothetical protein n=1 Tax=Streptomyces sp. NPDC087297 TaxID=3365778 RepID=UPI003825D89E
MDTHFGREIGQRLFQRYGSRDQWPENLAMAAASLQLFQQYLDDEAFDALMSCANEAHADLGQYRARRSRLRDTVAQLQAAQR